MYRKYLYPGGIFPWALSVFQFNSESYFNERWTWTYATESQAIRFVVW